ncbi:alpha-methylacyl-CoA racemase [Pseudonocardia thermophila]|uniref:Alpha-methylacyl-CoA racemase n=1 Tax=Pseudonocardia thermophila TaxID=1848 RepID=A0A1M6P403_PSETH|nr:CaiB/BaiF CoA-transferase family protein [Pseudonocardia thermophila]SHK02658.1 alpha-methylacyl-CoA racemase [Pseudonocardia thermophila]
MSGGPLAGLRVVEIAGIGPGPYAGMLLADLSAEVLRIDRLDAPPRVSAPGNVLRRNRRSLAVDLKAPGARELVLDLARTADVLLEPFRPGVAERLGIGPDDCLAVNPRLVYGRVTGWGREGPLAPRAGHDIDYLAVAGGLHPLGRAEERPAPPLNLVADFAGGALFLVVGVLAALHERTRSGEGQVVDAAMIDGVASLTAMIHGLRALGEWREERGTNELDTGSPYYEVYETADGGYLAVGAIEPKFYTEMLRGFGLDPAQWPQHDRSRWPALKQALAEVIATRTRDEWAAVFADRDACVAPVLALSEAPQHPHNRARGVFVEVAGVVQPAPAPRFGRTPPPPVRPSPPNGADTDAVLRELGYDAARIAALRAAGVVDSYTITNVSNT